MTEEAQPVEIPELQQNQEAEKVEPLAFFNRYIEDKVYRPETIEDLRMAYQALQQLLLIRQSGGTRDDLVRINEYALNNNLPTIAYIAGIQGVEHISQSSTEPIAEEEIQAVLNNFATLAFSMVENASDDFGIRPYSQIDGTLILGTIANASNIHIQDIAPTPETETQAIHMDYLSAASEVMNNRYLQLYLPRLETISIQSDNDHEGNPIFPDNRMINSRHNLASWKKMQESVRVGVPFRNSTYGRYENRLIAALIGMETNWNFRVMSNGRTRSSSKFDYIRLPAIERPVQGMHPRDLFESHLHEDGDIIGASLLNSLTYYGAVRTIRSYSRQSLEQPDSTPFLQTTRELLELGVKDTMSQFTTPVEYHEELFPSILDRALEEHNRKHPESLWSSEEAQDYVSHAIMCIAVRHNNEGPYPFTLRSQEEIEQLAVSQTVNYLPTSTLISCVRRFIHNPVDYFMNEDQIHEYQLLVPQVREILEQAHTNKNILEEPETVQMLKDFVSSILQVRYETIRDMSGRDTNEDEEDD